MTKAMQTAEAPAPFDVKKMMKVWERAQAGDASILSEARAMLANPATPGLVRMWGGELCEQTEQAFVLAMNGKDIAFREAAARKMA